jgi:hypothetical protein
MPTLTITPSAVINGQQFYVNAAGFHASTTATLAFAITGQPPTSQLQRSPLPTERKRSVSLSWGHALGTTTSR